MTTEFDPNDPSVSPAFDNGDGTWTYQSQSDPYAVLIGPPPETPKPKVKAAPVEPPAKPAASKSARK